MEKEGTHSVIDHDLTSRRYSSNKVDKFMSRFPEDEQRKMNVNPRIYFTLFGETQRILNGLKTSQSKCKSKCKSKPKVDSEPDNDDDDDTDTDDDFGFDIFG